MPQADFSLGVEGWGPCGIPVPGGSVYFQGECLVLRS